MHDAPGVSDINAERGEIDSTEGSPKEDHDQEVEEDEPGRDYCSGIIFKQQKKKIKGELQEFCY